MSKDKLFRETKRLLKEGKPFKITAPARFLNCCEAEKLMELGAKITFKPGIVKAYSKIVITNE